MNYEKLGAFYLGKNYDLSGKAVKDELLLYDSKDLTTHAACFGMTGSGKTGLCVTLLEEAAIDTAPAAPVSGMPLEPGFLFSENLLQFAIPELLSQTGTTGRQFAHLLIRAHQDQILGSTDTDPNRQVLGHLRLNEAGGHHVDRDVAPRQLARQRLAEHADAVVGRFDEGRDGRPYPAD